MWLLWTHLAPQKAMMNQRGFTMIRIAIITLMICLSLSVWAQPYSLDPSCLQSFNVKHKFVTIKSWILDPMECAAIERMREEIYIKQLATLINNPDKAKLANALHELIQQSRNSLANIEMQINKAKEQELPQAIKITIQTQMANIAVSKAILVCATTGGVGCAIGAAAAIFSIYSSAQSIRTVSSADQVVKRLKSEANELQNKIRSAEAALPQGLGKAIQEFNQFCHAVLAECL